MNVGLAGCGYLGGRHARKLRRRPDVGELWLYDNRPQRAAELASELNARQARTLDELIERTGALVVATSTEAHAGVAGAALRAGRPVLVEKPITRTLEEADRLLSMARAAGQVLMVGHVERFNPAIRRLAGRIEAPRFIEGHRLAAFQARSLDIDVVLDLMIHDIDLALHLTRELPLRIEAAGTPVLTGKVDIANARLVFPGGCVANLTASRVSLTRTRKIRFFMPQTYISVDLAQRTAQLYRLRPGAGSAEGPGAPDQPPARQDAAADTYPAMESAAAPPTPADPMEALLGRLDHESIADDGSDALEAEQSAFLAAARGEAENALPGEDGRAALAVALEIAAHLAAGHE